MCCLGDLLVCGRVSNVPLGFFLFAVCGRSESQLGFVTANDDTGVELPFFICEYLIGGFWAWLKLAPFNGMGIREAEACCPHDRRKKLLQ